MFHGRFSNQNFVCKFYEFLPSTNLFIIILIKYSLKSTYVLVIKFFFFLLKGFYRFSHFKAIKNPDDYFLLFYSSPIVLLFPFSL